MCECMCTCVHVHALGYVDVVVGREMVSDLQLTKVLLHNTKLLSITNIQSRKCKKNRIILRVSFSLIEI